MLLSLPLATSIDTNCQLKTQVSFGRARWEIFAGPNSLGASCLRDLENGLLDVQIKIKARLVSDPMFAAKIVFAADGELQNHLKNCRTAEDSSKIDPSLLNLSGIVSDIRRNRFFVYLPPLFKCIKPEDTNVPQNSRSQKGKEMTTQMIQKPRSLTPAPSLALVWCQARILRPLSVVNSSTRGLFGTISQKCASDDLSITGASKIAGNARAMSLILKSLTIKQRK